MQTFTYDLSLVALSLLIAILASYVGLDLVRRGRSSEGGRRAGWIGAGAVTVGGGIWSMHFVGMLALDMDMPVRYEIWTTIASALIAIAASASSFFVVAYSRRRSTTVVAGVLLGLAIVTMHYVGMAAIHTTGRMGHEPIGVALAAAIAIAASIAALTLAFGRRVSIPLPIAGLVLGLAIAGMHYVAMARMTMEHVHGASAMDIEAFGIGGRSLGLLVAGVSFMILFMGLATATFDQRLADLAKRENDALKRAHDFNARLLESTQEGIVAYGVDRVVSVWNGAMARITGIPAAEAVGRRLDAVPGWTPAMDAQVDRIAQGEEVVEDLVMSRTDRLCVVHGAPIRGRDGAMAGGLLLVRDESDLRRTQEALRQSQKLEALGHMTGSVAHDFNNLLMIIGGNLDLMPAGSDTAPYVTSMRAALENANSLIKKLLAFGRRQQLRSAVVDLGVRLHEFLPLAESAAGGRVRVSLEVDDLLPIVDIDINEFEIALVNLIVNAKDAMPDGGDLKLSAQPTRDGHVEVVVEDTGTGMSEETLAKAFEPFFTTKEAGKGSGLGLSQVYGFVKQSGGEIRVVSHLGKGTAVRMRLPQSSKPLHPAASGSMQALVMEGHPDLAEVVKGLLEQTGRTVQHASSQKEAMRLVATDKRGFDVVFMDAETVGNDDARFAEAMRHRMPGCTVLLACDHRTRKHRFVDAILRKPYSIDELETALRKAGGRQSEGRSASKAYDSA